MPKRMPKLQLLVGALATLATRATPQEEPPFPPGGGWLPLVYEKTADGYDNHDPKYLNKGECLPGSTVQLRGHIQCTSGNQECWKDAAVGPGFATVPAACRPGGTVTSTPAKIDGSASGYTTDGPSPALIVDSSGVMTLSAAAGDHWVLHLSGVTYDGASDWGLFFLITLAVCAVGYVGGGVGYVHKTQGAAPALTAHPHFPYWQQVRGLVEDGLVFTKAKIDEKRGAAAGGGALKEGLVDGDEPAGGGGAEVAGEVAEVEDGHSDSDDDGLIE